MTDRLSASALAAGTPVYWLLDLEYAGRTWSLADAAVDETTDAGETIRYSGGLVGGVEFTEGIDLLSDATTQAASASLSFELGQSVAQLVSRGHDLAGARGVLSRWVDGTPYEARRVVLSGVTVDPEYGADDEPVNLSLEASPWTDVGLIPASPLAVLTGNWPNAWLATLGEGERGKLYPIVIGRPGRLPDVPVPGRWGTVVETRGWCAGSQGVWAWHGDALFPTDNHLIELIFVIAGHHVSATMVYLSSTSYPGGAIFRCHNGKDDRGHDVAFVAWYCTTTSEDPYEYDGTAGNYDYTDAIDGLDVWGLGHSSWTGDPYQPGEGDAAEAMYVGWYDRESDGGGLVDDDGTLIRGAGAVLDWLLRQTSIPVDRGRWAAARNTLDRYLLDFTIDAQVSPWDFARQHLLPILPVSIVSGPQGLYGIAWRYDATARDAVVALNTATDPEIERTSSITADRSDLANRITVRYGKALRTGTYLASVTLDATDEDGAIPDLYCQTSQRRYRRPDGKPLVVEKVIETVAVYDDATATQIAQWHARAYALARRRVSYSLPEHRYGWLERGAVATITDAEVYLSAQVCLVEAITTDGSGRLEVTLLIIEDPARDLRASAA